ncbi:MAG TPA: hypothetical protein VIQ31_34165 [Phormidium sp.]
MSNIKGEFLFFCGSLIDVFKPGDEEKWTFSVRFGSLHRFTSPSNYEMQGEALETAKYHALIDMCWRSEELHFITSYPADRIITQSEELTAFLGGVSTNVLVGDLYLRKQERIETLKDLSAHKFVSSQVKRMQRMDGGLFEGIVTSRLFEFGGAAVLLEHLNLVSQ